jgi:hypothetical protein
MQELHQHIGLHYYHFFHANIDLKHTDKLDCLFFSDRTRFHLRAYVKSQKSRVWNYWNSHIGNECNLHFQDLVCGVLFHVSMWLDLSLSRTQLMETYTEISYAILPCWSTINILMFHHGLGYMALESLFIKDELMNERPS